MSETIDSKVVEMRLDNKQFENAAVSSISTLEKLKQSLNLTGASKGLEEVNAAAGKFNVGGMGAAIETVQAKFSALQVAGITALANITNSAVNTGKKMVHALTIEPITSGFSEYETKMNSIQTIMSNTASKGTTIQDVTRVIDELNTYADKTIYNFSEMTRNIGTFTAAGVGLEESAAAIQGIANLAAASGSSSQQASTAMYQLSQALAAGTVKLMDWNSVVNAGMGGEKFQEALKATARDHGIAVDEIIKKNGSFRDSLQDGWISADILNETLNKFTVDGAKAYAKSMMESGKWTQKQADALVKEAEDMENAATKVKTFTQLISTLKESLQSGWGKTWELIFGDFYEARDLFTGISDFLGGFIEKTSEFRNNLIEGAMGSPFGKLAEKIESVTGATENMTKSTKDYGKMVDRVMSGEFGNEQIRWDKIAQEGYSWIKVQNMVNEKLGDGTRRTEELTEAQDKQSEATVRNIEDLAKLSNEQLKNLGFNEAEIKSLKLLKHTADNSGKSMQELLKDMERPSGRTLLIESLTNVFKEGLVPVLKSVKDAWVDMFPPMTSQQLYDIIASIHKLSTHFVVGDETADKLTRTFKGLFAIVGMVSDVLGGGFKLAIKTVGKLFGLVDVDILSVTATLGDALVAFRKATDISTLLAKGIEKLAPHVKKFIFAFMDLPMVQEAIAKIKNAVSELEDLDFSEIGKNMIDGLKNGLSGGANDIVNSIIQFGISILEAIKGVLGIHSPSTKFFEIGTNIIDGLVNGIQNGISKVGESIRTIAQTIIDTIKGFDFGALFAFGVSAGMVFIVKKIADTIELFAGPLEGISDILENSADVVANFAKVVKSFSGVLKSFSMNLKAKALKEIAIAIAILVGSIALLAFMYEDYGTDLWKSVGIIAVLSGVLAALAWGVNKMSAASISLDKNGLNINGLKTTLLALASSLLLLALTVRLMGSLEPEQAMQGFFGLAGLIGAIALVFVAYGKLVTGKAAMNIGKVGGMLIALSISLLILTGVIKLIGGLSGEEISKGVVGIGLFAVFVGILIKITQTAGRNVSKVGGMMLKMSIAMLLMVGVIKLIGGLSEEELSKGIVTMGAFVVFIGLLTAFTRLAGPVAPKLGGILISMAVSMGLLVGVVKLIGQLSPDEIKKGVIGIAAFAIIMRMLIKSVASVGSQAPKIAMTLLAMSVSIGILAGIAVMLSLIDVDALKKGITAVGILSTFMSLMIFATRGANDCKGNLIVMAVAIGVMAAAVAALSFIDPAKLAGSTAALSMLMGAFALLVNSTKALKDIKIGPLIAMVGVVAILAGIVAALTLLEPGSVLQTTAALSILLLSLSGAMFIIGKAGPIAMTAVGAMALMGLVVGELAIILGLLSYFNVEPAIETVAALSLLLLSMSGALAIAALVAPMAMTAVGAMALMGLVVGELALILGLMAHFDVTPSLETAKALSLLLMSMSGALVILGVVGLMGPAAFVGIGALATLIAGIGGLVVAIGALATKFPQLEDFLNTGIPILEKIGYALGSFFGNIVGGFAAGATSGLPEIGSNLSAFMTNVMPFINGVKMVDSDIASKVGALSGAILALTAADLISGISSLLSGGASFAQLGADLSAFMTNAMPFMNGIKTIDAGVAEGVKALSSAILALTTADLINGITNFMPLLGGNSLADFGAQLTPFGESLKAYSQAVIGVDSEAISNSAKAAKALVEVANSLPNSGGLAGLLAGENDWGTFSTGLVDFGRTMVTYSTVVTGINAEAIKSSVSAAEGLVELAEAMPNTGGIFGIFAGENDWNTFGTGLVGFGNTLRSYANAVVGLDSGAIKASVKGAEHLVELSDTLPNSGGVAGFFAGENDWTTFGSGLTGFGHQLKNYSDAVIGLSVSAINNSVTAAKKIVELINSTSGIDTSGVSSFKSAVSTLGQTNVDSFVNAFSGASSQMSSIGGDMISSITKGLKSKQGSLTVAANGMISSISKSISGKANEFDKAGMTLITNLVKGMTSQNSRVRTAATSSITSAISGIRGQYHSFYSAGSYLVSGFASGISANAYKAAAKAKAMAKAAEEAAKKELDINSPSKVFRAIGYSVPEGFAMGIDRLSGMVRRSSTNMADGAVKTVGESISRIAAAVNTDVDTQPTIRPVVDMSDVQSKARAIDGMFGMSPSISLLSDVGTISSMMNRNGQNGNDDVVSAIDKLRKDLGNVGGNTYNVNGVTYDDGTNVSNTVEALIRAVKIERRV